MLGVDTILALLQIAMRLAPWVEELLRGGTEALTDPVVRQRVEEILPPEGASGNFLKKHE